MVSGGCHFITPWGCFDNFGGPLLRTKSRLKARSQKWYAEAVDSREMRGQSQSWTDLGDDRASHAPYFVPQRHGGRYTYINIYIYVYTYTYISMHIYTHMYMYPNACGKHVTMPRSNDRRICQDVYRQGDLPAMCIVLSAAAQQHVYVPCVCSEHTKKRSA